MGRERVCGRRYVQYPLERSVHVSQYYFKILLLTLFVTVRRATEERVRDTRFLFR